jgi:hypothetical protein
MKDIISKKTRYELAEYMSRFVLRLIAQECEAVDITPDLAHDPQCFQEGAKTFAAAHGIVLYELRAPTDEDWEGFITGVDLTGEICIPKVHDLEFKADPDWLAVELQRSGIASAESIPRVKGRSDELLIEREDGKTLITVGKVIQDHLVPSTVGPRMERIRLERTCLHLHAVPAVPSRSTESTPGTDRDCGRVHGEDQRAA